MIQIIFSLYNCDGYKIDERYSNWVEHITQNNGAQLLIHQERRFSSYKNHLKPVSIGQMRPEQRVSKTLFYINALKYFQHGHSPVKSVPWWYLLFILTKKKTIVPVEYVLSKRGNQLVKYHGFTYSASYTTGKKIRWRCSTHQHQSCPATIYTIDGIIVAVNKPHNHHPKLDFTVI